MFSAYRHRRMLDLDQPKPIALRVVTHPLEESRGERVGTTIDSVEAVSAG